MKRLHPSTITVLSSVSLATLAISIVTTRPFLHAAVTFGQKEIEQSRFIVMTVPRGQTAYNLLMIEQLATSTTQRACWQVNNDAAQTVEPLLLNFNFAGICGRGTDSNAFSIRMAGEDLGLKYTLRLVERGSVVVLVATPTDRTLPELELGRTRANLRDYMKIDLDPGWRLTRRTYNGRDLGHVYFTNNLSLTTIAAQQPQPPSSPSPSPQPFPSPSPSPSIRSSPSPSPAPTPVASPTPSASPSASPSPIPVPSPSSTAQSSPPSNTYSTQVQQLYREVLNREADAAGLAYHVRRMEQGRSLALVRQDLQASPEGRRVAIERIFQQETGKLPEVAIVDNYSRRIGEEGWSFDQVRQDIRKAYGTPVASTSQPGSRPTQLTGRFPENAYFVVIPASPGDLPAIAQRVRQLGVSDVNVFQRDAPRGPHVAIGPFQQRSLAEQWNTYFKRAGFDARVYYGN